MTSERRVLRAFAFKCALWHAFGDLNVQPVRCEHHCVAHLLGEQGGKLVTGHIPRGDALNNRTPLFAVEMQREAVRGEE